MSGIEDIYRSTLRLILADLNPAVRDRLKAEIKEKGLRLKEALDLVTAEAMRGWTAPRWFTKPVETLEGGER